MPDGLYGGMGQKLLVDGGAVVVSFPAGPSPRVALRSASRLNGAGPGPSVDAALQGEQPPTKVGGSWGRGRLGQAARLADAVLRSLALSLLLLLTAPPWAQNVRRGSVGREFRASPGRA